jgi:hypothetical protein
LPQAFITGCKATYQKVVINAVFNYHTLSAITDLSSWSAATTAGFVSIFISNNNSYNNIKKSN